MITKQGPTEYKVNIVVGTSTTGANWIQDLPRTFPIGNSSGYWYQYPQRREKSWKDDPEVRLTIDGMDGIL